METKEIKDVPTSTLENNKLIAEFMGAYVGNPVDRKEVMCGVPAYYSKRGFTNTHLTTDLKYHNSWDWLIPVLEECYQNNKNDDWDMWLNDALLAVNIDVLYNKIIEFIKWYNLNK